MTVGRQPVMVRLTPAQALRMERMGECLWPTEKLSAAEVTRRLALTQLLWAESERNMVESVRDRATRHDLVTPSGRTNKGVVRG